MILSLCCNAELTDDTADGVVMYLAATCIMQNTGGGSAAIPGVVRARSDGARVAGLAVV